MSLKQVLVGGGTGFIGSHLTKLLTCKGYDVTVISRMPGINRITWHELEKNGLPKCPHAVVNLAGQNVLDPTRRWTPGFKQNVWNSRVNTTAALTKAIINENTKPMVYVSLTGVSNYKPNDKKIYGENDYCDPYDFMSKLCLHWEQAANLPMDLQTKTRQVKIRCGVVIGRGGGVIQSLYLPFFLGLGGPIAPGTQPLPWIHIDDICNLILYSIENDKLCGVVNGVAPDIVTNAEFSKAFAKALRRPAIFPVPNIAVDLIFGSERGVILTTGAKIAPEQAVNAGFSYKYPKILEACKEVVKKI